MATGKRKGIDQGTIRIFIELTVLLVLLLVIWGGTGCIWCGGCGGCGGGEVDPITPGGQQQTPVTPQPGPGDEEQPDDTQDVANLSPEERKEKFFQENGLRAEDYPEWALKAYENDKVAEARDFLLNYPLKYGQPTEIDISGTDRSTVPLFLQWDDRWGYLDYGPNVCGVSGCGPTSLSMVAYYLTGDTKYTPAFMLQYATENRHAIPSGGTDWSLFGTGAKELGFEVDTLPLVKGVVTKRLEAGTPVVINVGESVFTSSGHYMVLVGYEDGYFKINDPNSPEKSQMQWAWDDIKGCIKNLWAISLPEA